MTNQKKGSVKIFGINLKTPIVASTFKVEDYISDYHYQDCCESVYIDFDHAEINRQQINDLGEITKIELRSAPEEGVIVNLYNGKQDKYTDVRVSIFLACRNQQNGYYNDKLDIIFKIDGIEIETNLNDLGCVKYENHY